MAFDPTDFLNSAEAIVVAGLKGESTVTALVAAANIHEKLKDDPTNYGKTQLPAIAVGSIFFRDEKPRKLTVICAVEVSHVGGDLSVIDALVKKILARVTMYLRNQSPLRNSGDLAGFDEQADDVRVIQGNVIQWKPESAHWFFVGGSCQIELDFNL